MKIFTTELSQKRWRRFKLKKRSFYSLWLFVFLIFLSFTSEFWVNSKPLVMNYNNQLYLPFLKTYHPSVFGNEDDLIMDYRKFKKEKGDEVWVLWPLIEWDPYESNVAVSSFPSAPTAINLLGTDDRGRDVLARLLYGFRYSITFSVFVWLLSFALGTCIGGVMGFFGGWVDLVGQRIVEVFEAMPTLLILITLVSIFKSSLSLLVIFSVFFGWMMISIYIRGEFLRLRKRDFVEGARAIGGGRMRQIFIHILPNSLSPIITFSPFTIASLISTLAILDYLGFGLPPPTPSWGELLQQAQKNFRFAWWLAAYPSLALFVTLVSLNLIGEGVRDAFDPRKS